MTKQKSFIDPANYHTLSQPVSLDEAQTRLKAFWEALYALRNEHKIPDVLLVARVNVASEDGEGPVTAIQHCGDEREREGMAAFAFGHERALAQSRLANLIRRSEKIGRETAKGTEP